MPTILPSHYQKRPFGEAGWLEIALILIGVLLAIWLLPFTGNGS